MAKNRTFTGSRQAVGTPTLNRNQTMQLIRMIRTTKTTQGRQPMRINRKDYEK